MRPLLIQICTVLSFAASPQNISPDNKVLIANFPPAATYSIQLKYTNGQTTALGSSKVYIAALFPQLDKLKMVKDSGDIIVTVEVRDDIHLSVMRQRAEFATMLANYHRFQPLPGYSKSDAILYFQPLNIVFELKGSTFFTFLTIGKLHSRDAQRNLGVNGQQPKEKTDALTSLNFLRSHIFELSGNPKQ